MSSIISQIEYFEGRIETCETRINDIDISIKRDKLSTKNRDELMVEKEQLSSALTEHQKNLYSLRHENRKTMIFSVAVLAIVGLIYILSNLSS